MIWIGSYFSIEAPDDWFHFIEGNRHVWQGAKGEELIVTASLITARWPDVGADLDQRLALRRELEDSALQAMRNSASHPDLCCIEELTPKYISLSTQQWCIASETRDGETIFLQALHCEADGIILVTLEAPRSADAAAVLDRVLDSVQVRFDELSDGDQ